MRRLWILFTATLSFSPAYADAGKWTAEKAPFGQSEVRLAGTNPSPSSCPAPHQKTIKVPKPQCGYVGVLANATEQLCPYPVCSVTGTAVDLQTTAKDSVDLSTMSQVNFMIDPAGSIVDMGNSAGGNLSMRTTGSIAMTVNATPNEEFKVDCNGRFTKGSVNLSLSAEWGITVTYQIDAQWTARYLIASGGSTHSASASFTAGGSGGAANTETVTVSFVGKDEAGADQAMRDAIEQYKQRASKLAVKAVEQKYNDKKLTVYNVAKNVVQSAMPGPKTGAYMSWRHQCPSACFPGGVKVATPDGERAIDSLKVGEEVLTFDAQEQKIVSAKISRTFSHPPTALSRVTYRTGERTIAIDATANHPFFIDGASGLETRSAEELKSGDVLLILDGDELIKANFLSFEATDAAAPVYNIEVEPFHSYFANGVLVHNKNL